MAAATPVSELLRDLNLGSSVAEFDDALDKYFVETEPFRALVENRADIIAGDKGTGKTAIFRILRKRYRGIAELKDVEVIPAFNPKGNPIFQRLVQEQVLTEAQYVSVWKAYIVSLVGNWLLEIFESSGSAALLELDTLLRTTGLRSTDDAPNTIFARIMNTLRKLRPTSAEVQFTLSESGIPIVVPRVELGAAPDAHKSPEPLMIRHEDALALLNRALKDSGVIAWIALDRLDEAFQGFPDIETPALRALLRTYLDLLDFEQLRLKLFVRRDLFRRIIQGGFVNLSHINARKIEIVWDDEDLLNLLCKRIKDNGALLVALGLSPTSPNAAVFDAAVPPQIDVGQRKPTSWNWIVARVRDGNNIKPPRNIIDLVAKAREAQLRKEEREPRDWETSIPLIDAESMRRGLAKLSEQRVEDTLLAEAGDAAPMIERFRGGKSEHNDASLTEVLGVAEEELPAVVKPLVDLGFLEQVKNTYKVPLLYRGGLGITKGKAF